MGRRSDPRWREQAALDLLNGRFLSALPADASGPILFVDESGPGAARGIDVQVEHWRREAHFDTPGAVVPPEGPFGIVCIRIPRSREALTYAVRQSASRLRPGGFVVVYGANDEGVGSAGSSLDEVGVQEVVTWASGKRCRVLGGRLPEPPVSQDPDSVRLGYTLQLPGLEPRPWVSWPGVFASERLDAGTRLLLESLPVLDPADTVLDWGAGSGEIGRVEAGDAAASARPRRTLADGVDADAALAEPVAEGADDAFEEGLRIAHLGVLREDPLRADVRERDDGTAVGEGVLRESRLHDPVERDGRDVERLEVPVVVEVFVGPVLPHVDAHADRVNDEINGAMLGLHLVEERFDLVVFLRVGVDDRAPGQLGEGVDIAEAFRDGRIRKGERGPLAVARRRDLPREAALVEGAEDDAVFALEEAVTGSGGGHRESG